MFAHHCTSCGRNELIFADQLAGVDNLEHGFRIHFTCWCGATQSQVIEREAAAA